MGEQRKPKPWAVIALALAGGALAFDQFILSASADDLAVDTVGVVVTGNPVDASGEAAPVRSGPTLAERFAMFERNGESGPSDLAAAFDVPSHLKEPVSVSQDAETQPDQDLGLRLSSILTRDGERLAIVNGRPLRIGDSVAGALVTDISDKSVTLDTAIGLVTLELKRPTLSE